MIHQHRSFGRDIPAPATGRIAHRRPCGPAGVFIRCAAVLLLLVAVVFAQDKTSTVSDALRDSDANHIPDRLNDLFTFSGVLTSDPLLLGRDSSLANFQDTTGGIVLFTQGTTLLPGTFKKGDAVLVRGRLTQHNGMEQLTLAEIQRLGVGTLPAPREALAADLKSERYSGQLVRLAGELEVPSDLIDQKRGLLLKDRSGAIEVLISDRFFKQVEFVDRLMKGGAVEIIGIASQYKKEPPYNTGYRLVPREPQDFLFPRLVPYRTVLIAGSVTILLAVTLYLWLLRRRAEQRAEQLARVTEDFQRSEAALLQSEERFRHLVEQAADAIFVVDLDGKIVDVNQRACDSLGFAREELLKLSLAEVEVSFTPERFAEFRQRMVPGLPITIDGEHRRKDGYSFPIEGRVAVIEAGGKQYLLLLVRDVTERKRFEAELAQARDAALESARLKSEFLANVSHEVRTPLNGIIGMTCLLMDTRLTPQQHNFVETARLSADSLLNILNDILDFSKIEAGKLSFEVLDFDLVSAVEGTVELLAERAQSKGIELAHVIHRDVPTLVRGDPGRLRQVLTNLLGNAIKFTEKGEVLVRVTKQRDADTQVVLHFSVTDTGVGVPETARAHIFDAFSQADSSTSRKFGGTGLGLAISKQLVQMMGGEIGLESKPGKGSTFWFTANLEKQKPATDFILKTVAQKFPALRVLVVDDNATNRNILHYLLASWGLRIDTAAHGTEALDRLRRAAASGLAYDLVILDMQMPGMDGLTLARKIKSAPAIAGARMVLLTSLIYQFDAEELHAAGIAACLFKPVKQTQLLQCLTDVMTGSAAATAPAPAPKVRTAEPEAASPAAMPRPIHILLAEDNTMNQKVAIGLLEKLGHRAEAVASGSEVLKAMRLVPYDIIFMDCQIPELDGYDTTREIRRREAAKRDSSGRRTYIIAMTASAWPGARAKCLDAGMDDYIAKPVRLADLEATLQRALENIRPASGNAAAPTATAILDTEALATLRELRQSNQPDPVAELIDLFLRDTPARLQEMRSAIANQDAAGLESAAHNLNGCASNLGAKQLAELCQRLEEQAQTSALDGAAAMLVQVEQEFANARSALELEKTR